MLTILAEGTAAASIPDWTPFFSAISSIGFTAWFGWHTATRTIPSMQKEHREERQQMVAQHAVTIKELVAEIKEEREAFDRWRTTHQ